MLGSRTDRNGAARPRKMRGAEIRWSMGKEVLGRRQETQGGINKTYRQAEGQSPGEMGVGAMDSLWRSG